MKNIHLLPTDKPSRLGYDFDFKQYYVAKTEVLSDNQELLENRNIYITSDEEIKEGDWCLILNSKKKYVIEKYSFHSDCIIAKKIILTDNKDLIKDGVQAIDDEFLEFIVKNPSCEFVKTYYIPNEYRYEIIIPQEEPKQETLEEAFKRMQKIKTDLDYSSFYLGTKWQQEQDKDKYSDEEVIELLQKYRFDLSSNKTPNLGDTTKNWFQQFKKK